MLEKNKETGCIPIGVFLFVFGTILCVAVGGFITPIIIQPRSVALESAGRYSKLMADAGQSYKVIDCLSADSDRDGKVTCTAIDRATSLQRQWHCESTLWAKVFGGSCSDARPVTINGGN